MQDEKVTEEEVEGDSIFLVAVVAFLSCILVIIVVVLIYLFCCRTNKLDEEYWIRS